MLKLLTKGQNEWDKLFPPEVNLSDFGNLPDFQFSTHFTPNPM
jgi:hypothetical protein